MEGAHSTEDRNVVASLKQNAIKTLIPIPEWRKHVRPKLTMIYN